MKNPWQDLLPAKDSYILEGDREVVKDFNRTAKPEHFFHTHVLPEPYLGNPEAPVVLLNLNPGYSEDDEQTHDDPVFQEAWQKCLLHKPQDYPFYLLNPDLPGAGFSWWAPKLRSLTDRFGSKNVANKLLCVEWFPYHSESWLRSRQHERRIPSQDYSAYLVKKALERNAVIICMRACRLWKLLVPELADYPLFFALRSPQNVTVSAKNCPEGFPRIIEALSRE